MIGFFFASLFIFQAFAATYTYEVSTQNINGVVRFLFSGDATGVNPDLNVKTGDTLIFVVSGLTNLPTQTFFIARTNQSDGTTQYTGQSPSAGLTTADGNLTLTIGTSTPAPFTLYYLSKISAVASGRIFVTQGADCSINSNNGNTAFDGTYAGAGVGDCFNGGNGVLQNGNICYPTCGSGSPGNLTGVCGDGIIKITGFCNGFPVGGSTTTPTPTTPTPAPSPTTVVVVSPTPSPSPSPSPSSSDNFVTYVFVFSGTSTQNCNYVLNTVIPQLQSYGNSNYEQNGVTFVASLVSCANYANGGSEFVIQVAVYGDNADEDIGNTNTFEQNIANLLRSNNNNNGITINDAAYTRTGNGSTNSNFGFVMQASVALFAGVILAATA